MVVSVALAQADEPLGERIGPFIFWPLLAFFVALAAWALVRRHRGGTGGRGENGVDWTLPESYADHHRVAWSDDPATFTPESRHWPLAVAAIFGICTGDPWDRLTFRDLDNPRDGLREAWGITSRPQLLSRLHWILREGHRVDFAGEVESWIAFGDDALDDLLAGAGRPPSEDDREQLWRLRQVRTNARGIREVRFEAWDLVRAAMLTRAGLSLGWLSEPEAIDTLNLLSAELQRHYTGWEEMGEHFLRARWYWGGNSGLASLQEDAHDASRQAALLDPERGPWAQVPWRRPIPHSRGLLVDAMVAEDLTVQTPITSPTPLAEVIDEVTIARLADRS